VHPAFAHRVLPGLVLLLPNGENCFVTRGGSRPPTSTKDLTAFVFATPNSCRENLLRGMLHYHMGLKLLLEGVHYINYSNEVRGLFEKGLSVAD
jgi:hypothetical protein